MLFVALGNVMQLLKPYGDGCNCFINYLLPKYGLSYVLGGFGYTEQGVECLIFAWFAICKFEN